MSDNANTVAIWGEGSLFASLWPYFEKLEQQGILEIVAIAKERQGKVVFSTRIQLSDGEVQINGIFLPAAKDYWLVAEKLTQAGIPRDKIWDARVVLIKGIDWKRFLVDRTILCRTNDTPELTLSDNSLVQYKREYRNAYTTIFLGCKSYIQTANIEGCGAIMINNFTSVSWNVLFELGLNNGHDYNRVFTFDKDHVDWPMESKEHSMSISKINIGSDVWIARGCILKASGKKPLSIGDGAVIAADSVVVNDIPPFAIVGGNPARLIKWRFPEEIRQKLSLIRWWDWSPEKIYRHRDDFGDPLKFIQKNYHDA